MQNAELIDNNLLLDLNPKPDNRENKSNRYWFVYGLLYGFLTLQILTIVKSFMWKRRYNERVVNISKGSLLAVLIQFIVFFAAFIPVYIFNETVFVTIIYSLIWAGLIGFFLALLNSLTTQMPLETIFKRVFLGCAVFTVIIVIGIFATLLIESIPSLFYIGLFRFLFGRVWLPSLDDAIGPDFYGYYGIFYAIVGSFAAMSGAIVIGGSLGVLTAVFLSKFCPKKLKPIITQIINLLAGIPSVVYGFFAVAMLLPRNPVMSVFGLFEIRLVGLGMFYRTGVGEGLVAVWIVLSIMILPITVALARASLDAVDKSYMEGALALGATKSRAVFRVILPAARSGVLAALILGVGRAIGETMAVVMVAGNTMQAIPGFFGGFGFRVMTGHIVLGMGYTDALYRGALVATGVVLLFFVLLINLIFNMVKNGTKTGESWLQVGKRRIIWLWRKITRKPPLAVANDAPVTSHNIDDLHFDDLEPKALLKNNVPAKQDASDIVLSTNATITTGNFATVTQGIHAVSTASTDSELETPNAFVQSAEPAQEIDPFTPDKRIAKSHKLTKLGAPTLKIFSIIASSFAVLMLIFIVFFILAGGVHHLNFELLFGQVITGLETSLASSLVATLMLVFMTSIVAFPLGIFAAIYLVEYAKRGSKLVKVIRLAVETIAGMPSIVFGLFGMLFFGVAFGWGLAIMGGSLTMAIMVIPATVRATEEALLAVPDSYREGSLALGAGKVRTVFLTVLPSALPGILAAVILGIGRMMAETAALMLTMGGAMRPMPGGYFYPATTLAVALFSLANYDGLAPHVFATASLLIIIVVTLNISATLIVTKLQKRLQGGEKRVRGLRKNVRDHIAKGQR